VLREYASVFIGPAGWSYPDWDGVLYPPSRRRDFDPLVYVSSYFNLIEINSTFYRVPSVRTTMQWNERVAHNKGFRFTLKAHQHITHGKTQPPADAFAAFRAAVSPLLEGGRLLAVLLQYPWSFKDTPGNRRRLLASIEGLSPFPVAVEVRHGSWGREAALAFLRETGVTICGVDQPVIGDSLTPRTRIDGAAGAYFRLHGRNSAEWFRRSSNRDMRYNYLYSPKELDPFVHAISRAAETAKHVVVVLNNHFRGQAVANALELASALRGGKVPVPPRLARAYPRLGVIDDGASKDEPPDDPPSLF
jgi:uncharacterized protein YecE (DUF72 family)